jgi:kynurenine formamidase
MGTFKETENVKYIDLSHAIVDGTVTFPGDPPASIVTYLDRESVFKQNGGGPNSGAEINKITIVSTSGTYLDAPYHVFEDGKKIKDYPLEKLVNIPSIVVEISDDRNYFDVQDIEGLSVKGMAVLFYSGHDKFFMTSEYGKNAPFLTVELANTLVQKQVAFVGIDTPLVDDISRLSKIGTPVHYILLGAEIPICEDMRNLQALLLTNLQ